MWDDDDNQEVNDDKLVRAALRFQNWRTSIRDSFEQLLAVWQSDDLDINWYGFAHTKGAFSDQSYFGGFLTPLPMNYKITAEPELVASGGFCAPYQPGQVTWQPWATYWPPMKWPSLFESLPRLTAERGGITYGRLPGAST